jgi:hypothetical protein
MSRPGSLLSFPVNRTVRVETDHRDPDLAVLASISSRVARGQD